MFTEDDPYYLLLTRPNIESIIDTDIGDPLTLNFGYVDGVFKVNDPPSEEKDSFINNHNLAFLHSVCKDTVFFGKISGNKLIIKGIYDTVDGEYKSPEVVKATIDELLQADFSLPFTYVEQ